MMVKRLLVLALLAVAGCEAGDKGKGESLQASEEAGAPGEAPAINSLDRRFAGTPAPEVSMERAPGETVTLAEVLAASKGKRVLVNLWATWCPPCQREMPVLQKAQAARPDVHFVFVNQGESAQQVAAYLARSGLQLRNVLLDAKGDAGTALGHRALPTTLFFDAEGRLVDTRLGELSEASLAERLANLPPSGPKK